MASSRFGWLTAMAIAAAVIAGSYLLGRQSSRPADSSPAITPPAAVSQPRSTTAPRPPAAAFGRPMAVVDLNSASLAEISTLPSITPEYARKIVAGRPYTSMSDVERAGIPRQVLEQISPPAIIRVNGRGSLTNPPPAGRRP